MASPASTSGAASGSNQGAATGTSILMTAFGNALKSNTAGNPLSNERFGQLLGELAKQGKLNQQQIMQLKEYADKHKAAADATAGETPQQGTSQLPSNGAALATPKTASQPSMSIPASTAFKSGSPAPALTSNAGDGYPISQALNITNPGAAVWPSAQQGRPTLTGGIPGGRMSGTPSQIARSSDDASMLNMEDNRARRKNTPGDQSMRRSIQDLVSSVDPNVKIEPEVEDLLLSIADEFIDSVTNFSCRLAKHRGGDTLEVRDLQLHLERNHNIRIPGFASDETRLSLSQSTVAPAVPAPNSKKTTQGTQMTLRSHRLAQVQQAKREAKLM